MRRLLAPVLVTGSFALLAGCGGASQVEPDDLASEVSARLAEAVGETPKSVECPDALPAEEGATVDCELEASDGSTFRVEVTATGVEDGKVAFNAKVVEQLG